MITRTQLLKIMPFSATRLDSFIDPLNAAMEEFGITTKEREAAFLAQVAHESTQLSRLVENLNYSAFGLQTTFKKYFTEQTALQFAKQPEKIANRVYANRNGNDDEASGDGWKFRGRGLIQITGKNNYSACSEGLFQDDNFLIDQPDVLEQPQSACRSAAWFWMANGLNDLADAGKFEAITRRINGGVNGLIERESFLARANIALNVS